MFQIPCRDLFHAHRLRSWLLSHDVEAFVLHEQCSGLWLPITMPVLVAISEDDRAACLALLGEPDPSLDDSFEEPPAEGAQPELPPFSESLHPTFLGAVFSVAMAGGALGLILTIFSALCAMTEGRRFLSDGPFPSEFQGLAMLPFHLFGAGAVAGVFIHGAILLALSCKPRDSQVRFRTRWLALVFLLVGTDAGYLISMPLMRHQRFHWRGR